MFDWMFRPEVQLTVIKVEMALLGVIIFALIMKAL
jgi:hypothetical protein